MCKKLFCNRQSVNALGLWLYAECSRQVSQCFQSDRTASWPRSTACTSSVPRTSRHLSSGVDLSKSIAEELIAHKPSFTLVMAFLAVRDVETGCVLKTLFAPKRCWNTRDTRDEVARVLAIRTSPVARDDRNMLLQRLFARLEWAAHEGLLGSHLPESSTQLFSKHTRRPNNSGASAGQAMGLQVLHER